MNTTIKDSLITKDEVSELDGITRFEVIDNEGRSYVKYGIKEIKLSVQDEGKTLKIFLTN